MKTSHLLLPALLVPAALATLPQGTQTADGLLRFAPKPGTTITKTFVTTSTLELDSMEMSVGGNQMPMSPEMTVTSKQSLTVTDEYGALQGDTLKKLTRTFDSISADSDTEMTMMGQNQATTTDGSSDLEGRSVTFDWNADTEEHDVSFAEGEDGDDELLDGLVLDLDLRGLLPTEELGIGDVYDIDPRALADVLAPGGDLHMDIESEGQAGGMPGGSDGLGDLRSFFKDSVEGDFTGKLKEVREADGARIAVVELKIDVVTNADLTELMQDLGNQGDLPPGVELEVKKQVIDFAYEGGGTLLWNVDAGHLVGLEIEATNSIDMDNSMAVQGQTMDMTMSMSGETKTVITTE
ncbi:MAG: hypothetical protein AAFU73_13145 [Planctomycetota bacterium]